MKKLFLFMVLMLTSWMGVMGEEITLQLTGSDPTDGEWAYRNVNNYDLLKAGDVIKATYDVSGSTNKQIYFAGPNGGDKFIETSVSETTYSFALTKEQLAKIAHGMTVGYVGLKNFKLVAERNGSSGSTTEPSEPIANYAPTNPLVTVDINKYIANWYGEDNIYRLKIADKTSSDLIGKILRVVCDGTGYDAYAFLKSGRGWTPIMSGADKFSIAGWKYFEITVNSQLADILTKSDWDNNANTEYGGLIIGGNNYTIKAAYIYGEGTTAEEWTTDDSDIINQYRLSIDGTGGWTTNTSVPGTFFQYIYKDNTKTEEKVPNTKNNIIRISFDKTYENAQLTASASGNETEGFGSYIRNRKQLENGSYQYEDYVTINADHYDFELSDAITVFKNEGSGKLPVVGENGTWKGMLSMLLVEGMNLNCNQAKITGIQIRKSQVSKYVTGLAVHNHKLSGKYWKPISLPYNLTQTQFHDAFGENAVFCELGKADVTKTVNGNNTIYGMRIHFKPVKGELNANYPYIICLKDESEDTKRDFTIEDVKADVRDFQTYTFRTPNFDCSGLTDDTERKEYEQKLKGAYMNFISTAPVFTIQNDGVGEVEIYKKTDKYTDLSPKTTDTWFNYAFNSGNIYAVPNDGIFLGSSLAYIQFSSQAKGLIDGTGLLAGNQQLSKSYFMIDGYGEDNNTTGMEQVETSTSAKLYVGEGVYNMNGQLLRKTNSVAGLPKGMYIIGGKKVIVK